jgi:hypothetical protein
MIRLLITIIIKIIITLVFKIIRNNLGVYGMINYDTYMLLKICDFI